MFDSLLYLFWFVFQLLWQIIFYSRHVFNIIVFEISFKVQNVICFLSFLVYSELLQLFYRIIEGLLQNLNVIFDNFKFHFSFF
jgi:hypothetical protein